jgi:hypothetical protein
MKRRVRLRRVVVLLVLVAATLQLNMVRQQHRHTAVTSLHDASSPPSLRSKVAFFQDDDEEERKKEAEESKCACRNQGSEDEAQLIILSKPWRYFSSSHWFHISEYYLPHHAALMATGRITTNATVIIVAPTDRFVSELTAMSFFLLTLSFSNGAPRYVEVVHPSDVRWIDANMNFIHDGHGRAIVAAGRAGTFVYDSRLPSGSRIRRSTARTNFVPLKAGLRERNCRFICARFVRELGAAPIERGFWFTESSSADNRNAGKHFSSSTPVFRQRESTGTRERIHRLCSEKPWIGPEETDTFVYGRDRLAAIPRPRWTEKLAAGFESLARNVGLTSPFWGSASGWAAPTENPLSGRAASARTYRLVLYQRNRDRRLRDADVAMARLEHRLQGGMGPLNATSRTRLRKRQPGSTPGRWKVITTNHDESRHPCEVLSLLRNADVLLTPHGFQSILLLFMPQGSAIFEIFPYKYWKEGYRPFANEYGLFHGWSQNNRATTMLRNFLLSFISQEMCMMWGKCREFARHDDVALDEAAIKVITRLALFTTGLSDAPPLHEKPPKPKK